MKIDPGNLSGREAYWLLISTIVPRPIAWISTVAPDGTPNLAPFSFFMGVTSDPPTLAVAIGRRRTGPKDTARNILESGEFVVNAVSEDVADRMVLTSGDFPPEVDEFRECGLTPVPADLVRPARVLEAPISMECRLERHLEIGRSLTSLVIGEVLRFHVRDELWSGRDVEVEKLRPLGRLGRTLYAPIGAVHEIPRPAVDPETGGLRRE